MDGYIPYLTTIKENITSVKDMFMEGLATTYQIKTRQDPTPLRQGFGLHGDYSFRELLLGNLMQLIQPFKYKNAFG